MPEPLLELVETGEQPVVGLLVRLLLGGEAAAVHAVVDVGVDARRSSGCISLAQVLRPQVGRAGAVVLDPLRRQVEGDLRVVVGDDVAGEGVDDRRAR